MPAGIGIATSDCTTSISHASTPIARRRRERDNWRSDMHMLEAYSLNRPLTTLKGAVAAYGLL